ncbi:hypothetical protein BD779DRAFT_371152 [Infundibulicybe gibba]|nr:hypothetical protein BD779DRAFT_371152 [Infundibulicybe gibba]
MRSLRALFGCISGVVILQWHIGSYQFLPPILCSGWVPCPSAHKSARNLLCPISPATALINRRLLISAKSHIY